MLDALAEAGLLSDARFAESYVRMRVERGRGPLRIRQELRERGVADDLAAQCLGEHDADWERTIRAAHRKKFAGRPPRDWRERGRQERFLRERGFTGEQVRALFGGLDDEAGGEQD